MTRLTAWIGAVAVGCAGLASTQLPLLASSSSSTAGCDAFASPVAEGSPAYWDGSGTQGDPFHNIITLAIALDPGETGCLLPNATDPAMPFRGWETTCGVGLYQVLGPQHGGSAGQPITIRSADRDNPVGYLGQLNIRASHVTVSHIDFLGYPCGSKSNLIYTVHTDNVSNITLDHLDVTYPRGICVYLAGDDMALTNSYIHDCGTAPDMVFTVQDSGAHGVYLGLGTGFTISDNVIADNKYRGLQTWPGPHDVLIEDNLFVGNAQNLNIGSCGDPNNPEAGTLCELDYHRSERVVARNNIIANSTFWDVEGTEKNTGQVYGFFPAAYESPHFGAGIDVGNAVVANCFAHPTVTAWSSQVGDTHVAGYGYEATVALPAGTNPTNATANKWSTTAVAFVDAAAGDYTLTASSGCRGYGPDRLTTTPTTTTSTSTTSTTSTSTTSTSTSTTSTTSTTTTVVAVDPHPVAFNGKKCTIVGTSRNDRLVGRSATDVICGLGGNDVILPRDGFDTVDGGPGDDTVDYTGVPFRLTINLTNRDVFAPPGVQTFYQVLSGVENAVGTANADVLVGNAGRNRLSGGRGSDTVRGMRGNDVLNGGDGRDLLVGGPETDRCDGGTGVDRANECEVRLSVP